VNSSFEIAVIGAGPGGYVAAIRAAQLGASVVLIEKDSIGGACLHRGCIPSKILIQSAKHYRFLKSATKWGFTTGDCSFDWQTLIKRKNGVVNRLSKGIEYLLRRHNVTVIKEKARLTNKKIVIEQQNRSEEISAEKIILATGSIPVLLPIFSVDRNRIITSREALSLETLPKSLVIAGGGVIGCEFAMLFSAFGVKVTLLEALPTALALSSLDPVIIKQLETIMQKRGIILKTNCKISKMSVDHNANCVETFLENEDMIRTEKALVCIGRRANTRDMGFQEAGIAINNRGEIEVNETMQTNIPGIFAIGDITGKWQLAHTASFQGKIAAEAATGHKPMLMHYDVVPWCIFTDPPAATVGLSEKEAGEKGHATKTGEFPYRALGKALATGESEGMVRVVTEKTTGQILGAHILGESAPELVHEFALAIQNRITAKNICQLIHAHPTYSESIPEACENIFGMGIHF